MLKNADTFYEFVAHELIDSAESYESYCVNIFNSNTWGDDLMASTIGHMWNVSISVIMPEIGEVINLFRDNPEPKIVIVANGGITCLGEGHVHTSVKPGQLCKDTNYQGMKVRKFQQYGVVMSWERRLV